MRGGRLDRKTCPLEETEPRWLNGSPVNEDEFTVTGGIRSFIILSSSRPISCGETERLRDNTKTTSGRGAWNR